MRPRRMSKNFSTGWKHFGKEKPYPMLKGGLSCRKKKRKKMRKNKMLHQAGRS